MYSTTFHYFETRGQSAKKAMPSSIPLSTGTHDLLYHYNLACLCTFPAQRPVIPHRHQQVDLAHRWHTTRHQLSPLLVAIGRLR